MITVVSEVNGDMQIRQYPVSDPLQALRDHIATLPTEPFIDYSYEQIVRLRQIAAGDVPTELLPVTHCRGAWVWTTNRALDGAPKPLTCYLIASS